MIHTHWALPAMDALCRYGLKANVPSIMQPYAWQWVNGPGISTPARYAIVQENHGIALLVCIDGAAPEALKKH